VKLELKQKPELSDHIQIRVPESFKPVWEQLRADAEAAGIDFCATINEVLKQFANEFRAQLADYNPQTRAAAPKKTMGRKPGRPAVSVSTLADLTPPGLANGADDAETD
jgi:hypothetical protein